MQQSEANSSIDILSYNSKEQLAYISSNAKGRDKTALLALSLKDKTITETNFSVNNLEVGNYQWRVKAENLIYETPYTIQSLIIE